MADHENAGYERLFASDGLTVGLSLPATGRRETAPPFDRELALASKAEAFGFDALWVRDVPTFWPKFGEAGQVYDPWVYLTGLANATDDVALATGSIVLPLRHPLHVAKAAASVDVISGGRLVLGVGTGDRPPEFAAFGVDDDERGRLFREAVDLLRTVWRDSFPEFESTFGAFDGRLDLRPKPTAGSLPLLVTGHARQELDWIGEHADGWLFYQLPRDTLEGFLDDWNDVTAEPKPFVMGLRASLVDDSDAGPEHVHQGFRARAAWFREYLRELEEIGVDHVVVSVDVEDSDPESAIERFATDVLERL